MTRKTMLLIGGLILAVMLLAGCAGGSDVTKGDRVDSFMSDINASSFDNVGSNAHPDASNYQQVQAASYWDTFLDTSESYTLSGLSISGDVGTATFNGGTYTDANIEFTFKNDPESGSGLFGGETDNYKIIKLVLDGSTRIQ